LYDENSKLGANAMMLRTLVTSPYFEQYRDTAKKIADGILSLMAEDGSFQPWFVEPSYEYDGDYLLTFYSGEALLALAEYYEKTQDRTYLDAAIRAQDYYVEKYVTNIEHNYYPAYVPWHTMSLYKLYHITKEKKYADAIFVLNDRLLELLDRTQHKGRFYNSATPQYGTPHASSDSVYTEGLVYAFNLARERKDSSQMKLYEKALHLSVGNLIHLQYVAPELTRETEPWRILGALQYSSHDSRIRIDTTQHAIDAYRILLRVYNYL